MTIPTTAPVGESWFGFFVEISELMFVRVIAVMAKIRAITTRIVTFFLSSILTSVCSDCCYCYLFCTLCII
jgi:hypothetical protein